MIRISSIAIGLALAQLAAAQSVKVVVYPVEAIADSAHMSKAAFQEAYQGIDATVFGLSDEGWYIRYQHELLTYLYGPLNDIDYTRQQKKLLEEIRLAAVLQSPSLSSSAIDIIRFDFNATPDNMGTVEDIDNPYLIDEDAFEEPPE